eukprot:gene7468-8056_t
MEMIPRGSRWRLSLRLIILLGILLQSYLMAVISSSSNGELPVHLQGKSYYQIEIYQKIYLINQERSHLYHYEPGKDPVLIVARHTNVLEQSLVKMNYDANNAPFSEITDVTGDVEGNLYISECATNRIYKLVPSISDAITSPQYTIELFAPLTQVHEVNLACPYGLFYLEYAENNDQKLKEGLYFINQQTCQIRFISKKIGITETFYTANGPCSSEMTFLSIDASSQTVYYLGQHPSTIHKLQLLTLPQQREGKKFLHERVLESDFQERIDDISYIEEEKGEERVRLLLFQRYLLNKYYMSDLPSPPSIAPTHIMTSSNNTSDLIYSSSYKARRRLQTASLLADFSTSQPSSDPTSQPSSSPTLTKKTLIDYTFAQGDWNNVNGMILNRATMLSDAIGMNSAPLVTSVYTAGTKAFSLQAASSQYIRILSAFIPPQESGMTIAVWFRSSSCSANSRVLDLGSGPSLHNIAITPTSSFIVTDNYTANNLLSSSLDISSSPCNANSWCHVVWTLEYAPPGALGPQHIYINGVLAKDDFGYYPSPTNRTKNYIGKSNNPADVYFKALEDKRGSDDTNKEVRGDGSDESDEYSEEDKMYGLIQEELVENNETEDNNNENNKDDYNDDSSDLPSFDWSFSEEDYDTDDVFDVERGVKGNKEDDNLFISSIFQPSPERDVRLAVVMRGREHEENEENSSSSCSNHTNNHSYDQMDEDSFKSIQ